MMSIKIDTTRKGKNLKDEVEYQPATGYLTMINDETAGEIDAICTIISDCNETLIDGFKALDEHINKTFESYEKLDEEISAIMNKT